LPLNLLDRETRATGSDAAMVSFLPSRGWQLQSESWLRVWADPEDPGRGPAGPGVAGPHDTASHDRTPIRVRFPCALSSIGGPHGQIYQTQVRRGSVNH